MKRRPNKSFHDDHKKLVPNNISQSREKDLLKKKSRIDLEETLPIFIKFIIVIENKRIKV